MHVMSSVFPKIFGDIFLKFTLVFCAIQMSPVRITRLSAKANQAIQ